jgi:DNA modification methylase
MAKYENLELRENYRSIIPSTSYLTHGIHPYTAKLIPQIPRFFIEKYTKRNDDILDPFCGSGTTLLEARLLGRNAVGVDINPLAVLISKVKVTPLDAGKLKSAIKLVYENINKKSSDGIAIVNIPNIDYWFHKKAQKELAQIKHAVERLDYTRDNDIYDFLRVCFSSIIRKSSYADTRMAKTYKSKKVKEKIKNGWIPTPIKYFEEALEKNMESIKLLSEILKYNHNFVKIFHGDARNVSAILRQSGIEKVDFILTSPPYINAQDYFRSYKLELWWLGLATVEEVRILNKQAIGTENISKFDYNSVPKTEFPQLNALLKKIWQKNKKKSYIVYKYFQDMHIVFKEFHNVLKNCGYFCLVTGCNTICRVQIPTYKIFIRIAENHDFKLEKIYRNEIKNRSLPPKRNHHGGFIKEEWITVFQNK